MGDKIKILLADDHSVVRHGISLILREACGDVEILHAENFNEVLVKSKEKISLIFLDINLPGGNSPKMIEKIREKKSKSKYPDVFCV